MANQKGQLGKLKQIMSEKEKSIYKRLSFNLREKMQLSLATGMQLLGRNRFRLNDFKIEQVTIEIPNLASDFVGYRIVQFSDIHMGHWITGERLSGVVQLVNDQEPDLVAITGDFVSYVIRQIREDMVSALRELKPKDVSVAVLGNHDHWMGAEHVRQILRESGVIELANEVYSLERNGASLHIAGVDDVMVFQDRLDDVLEKLPEDGPAILLAHEPDFADVSSKTGRFSLQISGHSHGGQVVLPGIGPLIRGPLFLRYPIGRYQVGDMIQYTNRGVGTHVFRLRINCPPEITVFTLTDTLL
jgi:predicted MPP superfamily phosphohydrolase